LRRPEKERKNKIETRGRTIETEGEEEKQRLAPLHREEEENGSNCCLLPSCLQ
jgi:hypothetical protein